MWRTTLLLSVFLVAGVGGVGRADTTPIGEVVVPAAPADVYAAVTNYAKWPYIFTDVKSVKIVFKQGSKTVVKVTSWHNTVQMLEAHTDEDQLTIRIADRGEPTAEATLAFTRGESASSTLVRARLDGPKPKRPPCETFDLGSIRTYFASR